jgi:hypothetical protein
MTIQSVLLPVFVLVFLLFFLLGWMIKERMAGKGGHQAAQARAAQVGACFQNQCEMPPLFFVLVILAIITKKADLTFVIMEWLFVLFRLGHAFIFTTTNNLNHRGGLFMFSALVLFLMWVIFAIRILLSPAFGAL